MAKNTGRSSRVGAVKGRTQTQNPKTGLWTKRDTTTGRFLGVKETKGAFKSVRRER